MIDSVSKLLHVSAWLFVPRMYIATLHACTSTLVLPRTRNHACKNEVTVEWYHMYLPDILNHFSKIVITVFYPPLPGLFTVKITQVNYSIWKIAFIAICSASE